MAVPVVQAFSVVLQSINGTSVTGTEPSGTINGDLLIAVISCDGGGETITANTPSDWTDITGMLDAQGCGGRVFYHRRGASAPDLQFNCTSGEDMLCSVLRVDGHIAAGNPIDIVQTGNGASASPVSPDASTTVDGVLVLRLFCGDRNRITTDTGYPSGMANNHYVRMTVSSSDSCSQGAADEPKTLFGSVGTATWTGCFGAADGWHGITIGVKSTGGIVRSVAGTQPSATGALSYALAAARSLAGTQPAASGVLTRKYQGAMAIAGVQPAAIGALSPRTTSLYRTIAGVQPSATGTLEAHLWLYSANYAEDFETTLAALSRSIAGVQPSASGALSYTLYASRVLSGTQPSATGALTRKKIAARAASGVQPAPSGTLFRTLDALRSLSGTQPASSGTLLVVEEVILRGVSGTQPSATGVLTRVKASYRSAAGVQLASVGTLAQQAIILRALAGLQPSAAGTLARTLQALRSLAGVQSSARGVLVSDVAIIRAEVSLYLSPSSVALRPASLAVAALMHSGSASLGLSTASVTAHQKSATLVLNTEGGN